jgi:hypothetical protein
MPPAPPAFGRRALLGALLLSPGLLFAQRRRVLKLTALSNGVLVADGSLTTLKDLDRLLAKLKEEQGVVWYYRESAEKDPPPQAEEAIRLIIRHELPVSMSSRPDYADYIDQDGTSKPRRP